MVCGEDDNQTNKDSWWSYIAVVVVILISLAWLISKMVIGGIYFNECPATHMIPIWLIVSGLVPLCLYSLLSRCMNEHKDSDQVYCCMNLLNIMLGLFMLAWHICEIRSNFHNLIPLGIFIVPASFQRLVYQRPWCVPFCLWECANKRSLAGTIWVTQIRRTEAGCVMVQSISGGADCISCNHFLSTFALTAVIVDWCIAALLILVVFLLFLYDKNKILQTQIANYS